MSQNKYISRYTGFNYKSAVQRSKRHLNGFIRIFCLIIHVSIQGYVIKGVCNGKKKYNSEMTQKTDWFFRLDSVCVESQKAADI